MPSGLLSWPRLPPGTLAPTRPLRFLPVRPLPSQFSFKPLHNSSILRWLSSSLLPVELPGVTPTLARTLMHCSIRPTVSVRRLLLSSTVRSRRTRLPWLVCPKGCVELGVKGRGGGGTLIPRPDRIESEPCETLLIARERLPLPSPDPGPPRRVVD